MNWNSLVASEVVAELKTDAVAGLSDSEAKSRLLSYGENTLPQPRRASLLKIFFKL